MEGRAPQVTYKAYELPQGSLYFTIGRFATKNLRLVIRLQSLPFWSFIREKKGEKGQNIKFFRDYKCNEIWKNPSEGGALRHLWLNAQLKKFNSF